MNWKMLKVNRCIRISSVYIFLFSRLFSHAVCKILSAEAVGFNFSFILSSIHRNLAKQNTCVNSYAVYGLKCWSLLFGHGEENNVLVRTYDPQVLPFPWVFRKWTYGFGKSSSSSWAVSAVMRRGAAQNTGKPLAHMCLAQEGCLQRKLKESDISFGRQH